MEDIIQILDDHIARSENVSENSEKPPSETDPLEELLALEQEEQESESDLEDEGIVNVVDTSDSDNDEVVVNPTELEAGLEMGERMGDNCPQENNNNQVEQKTVTQKPSSCAQRANSHYYTGYQFRSRCLATCWSRRSL